MNTHPNIHEVRAVLADNLFIANFRNALKKARIANASDVAQDVIAKFWERPELYNPAGGASLFTYMVAAAKNRHITDWRRTGHAAHPIASYDVVTGACDIDTGTKYFEEVHDHSTSASFEYDITDDVDTSPTDAELYQALERIQESISLKAFTMWYLSDVAGVSHKTISELFGIIREGVTNNCTRVRARIAEGLTARKPKAAITRKPKGATVTGKERRTTKAKQCAEVLAIVAAAQ